MIKKKFFFAFKNTSWKEKMFCFWRGKNAKFVSFCGNQTTISYLLKSVMYFEFVLANFESFKNNFAFR